MIVLKQKQLENQLHIININKNMLKQRITFLHIRNS
jgi:hypothetical protein